MNNRGVNLKSWEEFEEQIKGFENERINKESEFLYRGQGRDWELLTTLAKEDMDKKSRFPIRKFDSLEAMKDEEYRYWQGKSARERIAAVSEITTEAYRLKDPGCNVSRLQRTLVAVQRP